MYMECFKLMDKDKDGVISKNDLRAAFDNVGKLMTESELDSMLSEAGGSCSFDNMIKMFQNKMAGGEIPTLNFSLSSKGFYKLVDHNLKVQMIQMILFFLLLKHMKRLIEKLLQKNSGKFSFELLITQKMGQICIADKRNLGTIYGI